MRSGVYFTVFLLAATWLTGCQSTDPQREAKDRLLEKVFPAVVRIEVVSPEYGGGRKSQELSFGSGVIIDPKGLVVTNHHVAGKAERLICRFTDGSVVPGTLVGTDAMTDIAVIRLDLSGRPNLALPTVPWGNSDKLVIGESVFAMGCPGALAQSMTEGIVSNTGFIMPAGMGGMMRLDGANVGLLVRWILHDAQIFGGNSGGPLINIQGEIVGINEIGYAGLGGAVPANLARSIVESLIAEGRVKRAWSGIEYQPLLPSESDSMRAVRVAGVLPNSPAQKSGVLPGDMIVTFDRVPVSAKLPEDMPAVNRLEMSHQADSVRIDLFRNGKPLTFHIALSDRPKETYDFDVCPRWDMTVMEITPQLRTEAGLSTDTGVFVHSSKTNGAANTADPRIFRGDVIISVGGYPTHDLKTLNLVTDSLLEGKKGEVFLPVIVLRKDENILCVAKFNPPKENAAVRAERAWFPASVQVLTRELRKHLKLGSSKGVRITEIYPGRSVEKAGLKVGDIITALDGEKIDVAREEDVPVFTDMIRQYRVGNTAECSVIRDGKKMKLSVTLSDMPLKLEDNITFESPALGLTVRDLNFDEQIAREKKSDSPYIQIQRIENGLPCAIAMIPSGGAVLSVDGVKISDTAAFRKQIETALEKGQKRFILFVRKGIRTAYYEVNLP